MKNPTEPSSPSKKSKRIVRDLTEEEIEYYYSLLTEEIVGYDCGTLCSKYNHGIPYCCVAEKAVPLLYKSEFQYLQKKGDLWFRWKPQSAEDRELLDSARKDQVYCECTGVQNCIREQRSITCRTFPLEPYIDRRGVFVGLTFLSDFTQKDPETGRVKCPLTKKKNEIRQEFVDQHFDFWEKLLLRLEDEYDTYVDSSADMRRLKKKKGEDFVVLFPSRYKAMKSMREYLY